MSNRNAKFESHQHAKRVSRRVRQIEAVVFFYLLTGPALLEMTDSYLPEYRERLYPPTVTLSMFMMQALNEDGSCQKAVAGWAAQRTAEGLGVKSVNTGAYCKARQRLPVEMVSELARHTGQLLSGHALAGWRWRWRTVKLVDGTGISMPDTPENQARYLQPTTQAPGVGFPLARLVGVICLSTGALIDAAIGPHAGKETGELGLLRSLQSAFLPGDVMLADALYCSYFLLATLQRAGVDVLVAQHGSRITDFRRGEKLGARDHRVSWSKPNVRPDWMSQQDYVAFPALPPLRWISSPCGRCRWDGWPLTMLLRLALQIARDDYEDRRERQRQGVELAKRAGKYAGRQPNTAMHDRIIALRTGGHGITATAKLAGCCESQVKRVWALRRRAET